MSFDARMRSEAGSLRTWIVLSKAPISLQFKARELIDRLGSPSCLLEHKSRSPFGELPDQEEVHDFLQHQLSAVGIEADLEQLARLPAAVIGWGEERYPPCLAAIHQPPLVLYERGELASQDAGGVALVGTRQATRYGKTVARRLARGLAEHGITVISGLARGIDGAAHEGALEGGGRTVAVLGSGVDVIYPKENSRLVESIVAEGCGAVISELPVGSRPMAHHFPQRNRIISGLSRAVVVVEAPLRSGALITARFALEQGREVFAVPGPVTSPYSRGVHRLIRDGAGLVEDVEDIIRELQLPLASSKEKTTGSPALSLPEHAVLQVLSEDAVHIDAIGKACGLSPAKAAETLMRLQLRGRVRELPGKLFHKEV